MRKLAALSLCIALLLMSSSVFAWGPTGHMLVAQIAMMKVKPKTKAAVIALLKKPVTPKATPSNSDFATSACWADDIKSVTKEFNTLHFIDIPFSDDGTTLPQIPAQNIIATINEQIQTLKDPTKSAKHSFALRMLMHLVGDIHQPLHCAERYSKLHPKGDRGGNDFKVTGEKNLHSFWDGGINTLPSVSRPLSTPGQKTLNSLATAIMTETKPSPGVDTNINPDAWSKDSHKLAVGIAYKLKEKTKPSATYTKAATKTVRSQIAHGGYRLAAILDDIFGN